MLASCLMKTCSFVKVIHALRHFKMTAAVKPNICCVRYVLKQFFLKEHSATQTYQSLME